ncbi:MAG: hypothetical protein JSU63_12475 [Phycisphaerales bacterium]|nr:MAG: hypothetical protein JSU63_12475 [Phycisphaerales bacterium]
MFTIVRSFPASGWWLLPLLLAAASCAHRGGGIVTTSQPGVSKDEEVMAIDQKLFLDVPLNTDEPNPCSPPEPDPDWLGMVIQAPQQVTFKRGVTVGDNEAFAAIPICGYMLLEVLSVPEDAEMLLVAVDRRSGKIYRGEVVELDPSPVIPPPPSPPLSDEELEGLASGGYFNPNLADFVPLPQEPGEYHVHVEFGKAKSNEVTIKVVEEK